MSLGTIFTIAIIGAIVCGFIWGKFKVGVTVLLGIAGIIALAIFTLPYLLSAIAFIFSSSLLWGIIIFIILAWICQVIFR